MTWEEGDRTAFIAEREVPRQALAQALAQAVD